MKTRILITVMMIGICGLIARTQEQSAQSSGQEKHVPPPQAYADCKGKKAGDTVQHTTREGVVPAVCVDSPQGLVARPNRSRDQQSKPQQKRKPESDSGTQPEKTSRYSIDQATSDRAQLNTIAFDGLAFLTGDFDRDTFLPPGKVSDFFGFQYMRDIDSVEGGHNTSFLTNIAENTLAILNAEQKAKLVTLAESQQKDIRRFAEMRFPLIKAFRQNLEGKLPAGSKGLSKQAIMNYSAELYQLDGRLAFDRAKVMGAVMRSLSQEQQQALAKLKFGDSRTWPDVGEQLDKRSMSHDVNVAVMTYASEMFSWYAGSVEADTYFCPERHGMYFGGFGMKTAPAMGKRNYSISTSLTGNSGEGFLAMLSPTQHKYITDILDLQREDLKEVIAVRRNISTELRKFLSDQSADKAKVLLLAKRYGELDGEMSYFYATAFAKVGQSLSAEQKQQLASLRSNNPTDPHGPFIYSSVVRNLEVRDTRFLFGVER